MSLRPTRIAFVAVMLSFGMPAVVAAASHNFTFRDAEFGPRDSRVQQAQAYVARTMAPGTSMESAIRAAKAAGARCAKPAGGSVLCTANFMQQHTGDGMFDIQWRMRIIASRDGQSVTQSSVRRITN